MVWFNIARAPERGAFFLHRCKFSIFSALSNVPYNNISKALLYEVCFIKYNGVEYEQQCIFTAAGSDSFMAG